MIHITKEWFSRARVGLFTHYTYGTYRTDSNYGGTWYSRSDSSGAGTDAEEAARAFDADNYARAAWDMGAQYVVFTACHAGFNLLFPSETMRKASVTHKTSDTDVIAALLESLGQYDIPLVLYMPPNDNHDITDVDLIKMGWMKPDGTQDDDGREIFINTLLREINARYRGITGIWFDQCGPRPSAADALREGNEDAVIFVNRGITADNGKNEISDFYVSEYYGQIPAGDTDAFPTHHSQINRIFGGSWWACGGRATADAQGLFRYTVRVAATEGQYNCGVNWACGQYLDGTWENGVRELMSSFGDLMRRYGESIYDTVPSVSYVTPSGSVLESDTWGVATETADGSRVFLHILNPPPDGVLRVGYAADGKRFESAALLGAKDVDVEVEVSLTDTGSGYAIRIPHRWGDIDTVVVLKRWSR